MKRAPIPVGWMTKVKLYTDSTWYKAIYLGDTDFVKESPHRRKYAVMTISGWRIYMSLDIRMTEDEIKDKLANLFACPTCLAKPGSKCSNGRLGTHTSRLLIADVNAEELDCPYCRAVKNTLCVNTAKSPHCPHRYEKAIEVLNEDD